jgi:hypothetical protein
MNGFARTRADGERFSGHRRRDVADTERGRGLQAARPRDPA